METVYYRLTLKRQTKITHKNTTNLLLKINQQHQFEAIWDSQVSERNNKQCEQITQATMKLQQNSRESDNTNEL